MGTQAISDTGPILHLDEIGQLTALDLWRVRITPFVAEELTRLSVNHNLESSSATDKNTQYLATKHDIAPAEASVIALAQETNVKLIFTDDLAARNAATSEGLEPHGTIGILLANFARGQATKTQIFHSLSTLHAESSLFVTRKLIDEAMNAVKAHTAQERKTIKESKK